MLFISYVLLAQVSWAIELDELDVELSPSIRVLSDMDAQYSAEQAHKLLQATSPNNSVALSLPNNQSTYWLWLPVGNQSNTAVTKFLNIDYIFINHSTLYQVVSGRPIELENIDSTNSIQTRNVVNRQPIFEINVEANTETTYLLRLNLTGRINAALEIRPKLMSLQSMQNHQLTQTMAFFFLLGLLIALATYNTIIYLKIGIQGYIYYSLYLYFLVLTVLLYEGILLYLPSPPPLSWIITGMSLTPVLASLSLISFGRNVLQLAQLMPRIDRLYRQLSWFIAIFWPVTVFYYFGWLSFAMELTVVVLMIALGVIAGVLVKRGLKAAVYFCISFIFIALGYGIETILYSIPILEKTETSWVVAVTPWIEQYFFYTCAVIEVFFLSLALSSYIDVLRSENIKSREMKINNEKLIAMDRLKTQFLTNISHEFRTPLTLILSPLKHLLSNGYGNLKAPVRGAVEVTYRNANRLSDILEELMMLSRLENHQLTLQVRAHDVTDLSERMSHLFKDMAEQQSLELSLKVSKEPITLFYDDKKIESVLCNLLSNAIKYTPRGGQVIFSIAESETTKDNGTGRFLEFTVADNGSGIPIAERDKIFGRFYRMEEHAENQVPGNGIGLALVKEIVDMHGGKVSVKESNLGGSLFCVQLPFGFHHFKESEFAVAPHSDINELTAPYVTGKVKPNHVMKPKHSETILLVEDIEEMRIFIANILGEYYRVVTAGDGKQALASIESNKVDLIVSDVMMPIMNGFELLAQVRANPTTVNMGFIVLTARNSHTDKLTALEANADGYLPKPFDIDELLLKIKYVLAIRKPSLVALKAESEEQLDKTEASQKPEQDTFITSLNKVIYERLSEPDFDVEKLATAMNISKPTLHRRLEKSEQTTPAAYMRKIRLSEADRLIKGNHYRTVAEVAHAVGFGSTGYFSRLYKQYCNEME